jgi:hypothetical protein
VSKSDGGELGRGLRRNAAAMHSSLEHLHDRFRLLQSTSQVLTHPLADSPKEVIDDLASLRDELSSLFANYQGAI